MMISLDIFYVLPHRIHSSPATGSREDPEGVEPGKLFADLHPAVDGAEREQPPVEPVLGSAPRRSIELEGRLQDGGARRLPRRGPIQYRECMEHESDLFMSYFKTQGLEYISAAPSCLNKVGIKKASVGIDLREMES